MQPRNVASKSDFFAESLRPSLFFCCHSVRSASTIFKREARTAGRNPPTIPMINEKISACITRNGESLKLNASSENVFQFIVEIETHCNSEESKRPAMPSSTASNTDSIKNEVSTLRRRETCAAPRASVASGSGGGYIPARILNSDDAI